MTMRRPTCAAVALFGAVLLAPPPATFAAEPAKPAKTSGDGKSAKKTDKKEPKAAEPLFRSSEPVQLTITAPISALTKGGAAAEAGLPGTVRVAGSPEVLPITLRPRGITRRKRETCPFPPMWLDFVGKPPANSVFKGQNKLKLVSHCRSSAGFQQYVLVEYAAYRLYNVLTPTSFNVRLANIDYVETDGKPVVSRIGFLIEDGGEVAKRNQINEVKGVQRIRSVQLDARQAVRVALFQYMIGNLDWAMTAGPPGSDCCHNARLFNAGAATTGYIPAPYDFDYSGLVDAPYAVPPASLKIASVRTRRYRGYCSLNAEIPAVVAEFNAKRPQLLAVFDDIPGLEPDEKAKARKYLEGFFEEISTPDGVANKIEKACL
jgi:hypothetical protein